MKISAWAKFLSCFLAFLLLLCGLTACIGGDDKPDPPSSGDPSGEEDELAEYPVVVEGTTIRSRPSKVVSLSPALTEKLYELDLQDSLVGVSDFCDYPLDTARLPKCGTAQLPDLEKIEDLAPHLILTQSRLAEEDLIALQQMDADVVVIPAAASIEDFKNSYISLSRLLEGEYAGGDLGRKFAKNLQDRLDHLESYLVPYAEEHGVKPAIYLRLLDFNVATGGTLENELMSLIGLRNIAADQEDWLYPEELARGEGRAAFESVEVIYMDEKFVNIKMLEQSAYYKGLQATLKDWYLYIDSLVFERQSLRMLDILEDMAAYAYPDATPPIPFVDSGDTDEAEEPAEAGDSETDDDAAA